jgi:diaminopimelate decarboxylase
MNLFDLRIRSSRQPQPQPQPQPQLQGLPTGGMAGVGRGAKSWTWLLIVWVSIGLGSGPAGAQVSYQDVFRLAYADRAGEASAVAAFEKLAGDFGTPLYLYDQQTIESQYQALSAAFGRRFPKVRVFYALKANSNPHILHTLARQGAGAEVVSEGEIRLALRTGIPGESIIFTSSSKSSSELELAVGQNILINVDSLEELDQLQAVAEALNRTARICIRVNPDVDPDTLAQINTGKGDTKFGIPIAAMMAALEKAQARQNLKLCGLHCHIGSQITSPEGYELATEKMLELVREVSQQMNLQFEFLDLGGGFGIPYQDGQSVMSFDEVAAAMHKKWEAGVAQLGYQPELWLEPGRSLVAQSGLVLTRVNSIKVNPQKTFINVDAGFNTLARPAMYGSYHRVRVAGRGEGDSPDEGQDRQRVDIAGCICETGDILAKDRSLPAVRAGDLLIVLDAGAYGFSMASRYNSRPLPAEVLIQTDGQLRLIRQRESFESLWENVPEFAADGN